MNINETLEAARDTRTSDQLDQYLKYYDVLVEHMDSEENCVEVLLGDIYLETTGHKELALRYRNPAGHPTTLKGEYYDMLFGCTDAEFKKDFAKWLKSSGQHNAMMTCIKWLNGGKNDLSLRDFDIRTIEALANFDAEPVYRALDQVMRENDKKIPNVGPRSLAHVNAAMKTLVKLNTPRALQSLFRLQRYARYAKTNKSIELLMGKLKLSAPEIEDLKTPTYNFDDQFCRTDDLGEVTVITKLLPGYKVEQKIADVEGREYAALPKALQAEFKDEVKELKGLEKLVLQDLRFLRDRIEETYRTGQTWAFSTWMSSYIDHPLKAYSAKRLIWEFVDQTGDRLVGLWADETADGTKQADETKVSLFDQSGKPLPQMDDRWVVKLWHPINASQAERKAWKDRMMALQIVQPFKQAFREIYTITPPELFTNTYSDRFAAHILFAQQCLSIASSIGWIVPPISNFYGDDFQNFFYTTILDHHIEFVVDYPEMSRMHTDRVVFQAGAELTSIPPLVFSEAMRDIDLFVSVCSIGVDPTWTPDREGYAYWSQYSTSELSESAIGRKDLLERLLPGLPIASQCRIEDKWLIVEGQLCRYKIHIGSGGVYMSPSDKYLCIVPTPTVKEPAEKIFLPFESDTILSLILSKAFLLANDKFIKDKTILTQIKSH